MAARGVPTIMQCSGCGATLAFEKIALSLSCGYCDSPIVDEPRATATLDAVVPFALPARGAIEGVRAYLDGRRLAPADLRTVRLHPRELRGVLVPFWVYAGTIRSKYQARVGVDWFRSETYTDKQGKERKRQVRETEWFRVEGSAAHQIDDHLVCASRGLAASEAATLGEFDLGHARPYDPRLLSGFEAELPSLATREGDRNAQAQLREAERVRIREQLLPGDRNRLDDVSSDLRLSDRRLVLLPVWILSYRYRDELRRVLVNGQSGAVSGDVPLDRAKLAALALIAAALLIAFVILARWLDGAWS